MNNITNANYDKLLGAIEKTVTDPGFYWQSLSMLICFGFSILFYRIAKKFLFSRIRNLGLNKNPYLNSVLNKYLEPLFLTILILLSLSIGLVIFNQFYKEAILFVTTIELIALFLFLRFLRISLDSTTIANLVGFFLVPALILNIFGLLGSATDYLDGYAIKIGAARISIYTAVKAFIILLIVFWVAGLLSRNAKSYVERKRGIKSSTKGILNKAVDILVYFIVFIISLKVFGFDMTTFAVIGGAIGVGIGFGLQKISSNFISGIILLFEKSVEIGNVVELDDGKIYGIITHFSARYTLIEAYDGKEIMIPNEDFITSKVTNLTYNNSRGRIEVFVNVSYDSDIKKARELMIQAAKECPRCLHYPVIESYIVSFEDSSVKLLLYFWVGNVLDGRLQPKSEVMASILEKFKENNIVIPYPQREVLIKSTNNL